MKRIETREDAEKKKKRNARIISSVLLGILLFSSLGYALIYSIDSGTTSEATNGFYRAEIEGRIFQFSYFPEDLSGVVVEQNFELNDYRGKPLYLVSNSDVVNYEIGSTLGFFASKVQRACFGTCEENLPEKDCSENLIIWKDSTEEKILKDQNCVFIDGDLQTVDAFLFDVFGL